jgi:hypothetical protein
MSPAGPPAEDKALLKLAAHEGATRASALKISAALVEGLVTKGLVASSAEAGSSGRRGALLVEVTPLGRQRAAELRAAEPAPAPRRSAPRAPAAAIEERLARIEATLEGVARQETLLALLARLPSTWASDPAAVRGKVLAALADLDERNRYHGLVPIPELRRALDLPDGQVTAALLELEAEYQIDLNVAQSPTLVPDRQHGIERPGRGLLYYVARRAP